MIEIKKESQQKQGMGNQIITRKGGYQNKTTQTGDSTSQKMITGWGGWLGLWLGGWLAGWLAVCLSVWLAGWLAGGLAG